MKANAKVIFKITKDDFEERCFEITIPDDIITEYARHVLNLMTPEDAYDFVEENPPEMMCR
jgi:hypothetical protein